MPVPLRPDVVLPALRGAYGREYHYAPEAPTTQRMLPPGAAHGAVALTEHQTEGRGRLGRTWIDESGTGLLFSVVLQPPLPVAQAERRTAVARQVAGILAEAQERVVLGIGINVGSTAWAGAGAVEADRLVLLVDVLERLELGYESWLTHVTR